MCAPVLPVPLLILTNDASVNTQICHSDILWLSLGKAIIELTSFRRLIILIALVKSATEPSLSLVPGALNCPIQPPEFKMSSLWVLFGSTLPPSIVSMYVEWSTNIPLRTSCIIWKPIYLKSFPTTLPARNLSLRFYISFSN